MFPTTPTKLRALAVLSAMALLAPFSVMAQQTPTSIVAAAVRDAGHACKKPAQPVADPKASNADEEAWIIQCETGRYRVKFTGDRGAKVESLPGS